MSDPVDEIIETVVETVEEAGEQLVSLKPSKTLLVLLAVGGLAAGICVGWYLAGGMKIEEEFYATEPVIEVVEVMDINTADEPTDLEQ